MRKKFITLCIATLMAIAHGYGGVVLTVPDVNIAKGGTANVVIYFDLGTQPYTAYQMDIAYPDGIQSVTGDDGNPLFTKGDVYAETHNVSSIYAPTTGNDRFQCFEVNSATLTAQSGILLILPIKAQKSLAEGTYQATIDPIEFVLEDATPDRPGPVTFNINVTNNVVLDEEATIAPTEAKGVDVIVRRTLKADEWSTICLPFAMNAEQVKAAFGSDVRIGDFKGYVTEENAAGDVVGIMVNFADADAIEANHPYIIKVSGDVREFAAEGVDIVPVAEPLVAAVTRTRRLWSEMVGTYVAQTVVEKNMLFLSDNLFWYSDGQTKMKAFRAYFDFYDVLSEVEGDGASTCISLAFDDGTTVVVPAAWREGADGHIYDLQGRRVETPAHGVYVSDGKKVIIK